MAVCFLFVYFFPLFIFALLSFFGPFVRKLWSPLATIVYSKTSSTWGEINDKRFFQCFRCPPSHYHDTTSPACRTWALFGIAMALLIRYLDDLSDPTLR